MAKNQTKKIQIFETRIPPTYTIRKGLSLVYGLSQKRVNHMCKVLGFNPEAPIGEIEDYLSKTILPYAEENFTLGSELKRSKKSDLKKLVENKSYRGRRHLYALPVRGQRTSTNAKTQKRLSLKRIKK